MASVTVHGSDGSTLSFDGETVEIGRKGGFGSAHRKGSKRIPVRSIAAVQFKEPGLTVGFIQFTIGADQQRGRGGTASEAVRDENAVVFRKDTAEAFRQMREVIEMAMRTPAPALLAPPAPAPSSMADELVKLAGLRDAGVLSPAEFDAAKARLLGA